ncbi:MAG: phasin family protein [Lysobacterales bacterium]
MSQFTDLMKPEVLFSAENPILQSARKTHKMLFDAVDKSARVQLAYAEELLDLNAKRFEVLVGSESPMEAVAAYQDLAFDVARSASQAATELQDVVSGLQFALGDAAADLVEKAEPAPKAKKAKAA